MRKNALYLKRILKLCLEFQTMIPLFFINRDELESLLFFTVSIFSFSPITKLGASSFTFTLDTISSLTFFPVLWEEYVFTQDRGGRTGEDVPRQFQLPSLRIRSLAWGAPGTRIHSLQFKLNSLAPFLTSILKPFNVDWKSWKGFYDRQVWCWWKAYVTRNIFNCSVLK